MPNRGGHQPDRPGQGQLASGGASIEMLIPSRIHGSRADSLPEGGGFEPPVPRPRRHPSATANHLASYHLPRKLGLRFAPKASTPSRKSSEPRRPRRKRLTSKREL